MLSAASSWSRVLLTVSMTTAPAAIGTSATAKPSTPGRNPLTACSTLVAAAAPSSSGRVNSRTRAAASPPSTVPTANTEDSVPYPADPAFNGPSAIAAMVTW